VGRQISHREPGRWQSLLRPVTTADRRAQRALREDVKAAKESLSRHPQTEVPLPEPFDDVLVTRVELEALIRPGLLRSVELLAATIRSTGITPDRLVGIYLVGGSSRIPVIATLIAENLRVVPTSLDQPETAVALGAHHVPHEGITMRTGDMSATLEGVQRSQQAVMGPRPGGFAGQGGGAPSYPGSGPQRVMQPGPQHNPMQAPAQPARAVPQPQYPMQQPQHGQAPPAKSKKPLLIGGALLAVLVIAVTSVIIATSGGGSSASCDDHAADDKGFTHCMRELAGPVAENNECTSGVNLAGTSIQTPGTESATCQVDAYSVVYYHSQSADVAQQNADAFFSALGKKKEDADSGDWEGGGHSGVYYFEDLGMGLGMLLFTVNDSPIWGVVAKLDPGTSSDSAGEMPDFFNEHIKPGADGGTG
jgi:hypothetical protein